MSHFKRTHVSHNAIGVKPPDTGSI